MPEEAGWTNRILPVAIFVSHISFRVLPRQETSQAGLPGDIYFHSP